METELPGSYGECVWVGMCAVVTGYISIVKLDSMKSELDTLVPYSMNLAIIGIRVLLAQSILPLHN